MPARLVQAPKLIPDPQVNPGNRRFNCSGETQQPAARELPVQQLRASCLCDARSSLLQPGWDPPLPWPPPCSPRRGQEVGPGAGPPRGGAGDALLSRHHVPGTRWRRQPRDHRAARLRRLHTRHWREGHAGKCQRQHVRSCPALPKSAPQTHHTIVRLSLRTAAASLPNPRTRQPSLPRPPHRLTTRSPPPADPRPPLPAAQVTLDAAGRSLSHSELVTGWLRNEGAPIKQQVRWGRPVDVAELPDGSVLVSDDTGDAVYRITYQA